MARKKPISGKARRIKLLTKRAERIVVITPHPLDEVDLSVPRLALDLPPQSSRPSGVNRNRGTDESERGKEYLHSRFLRLPLVLLNHHRLVAATEQLPRPIPPQFGYCLNQDLSPAGLDLSCPRRPKWSYNSSKLEVEKNEEGVFKKWLATTDATMSTYAESLPSTPAPSFFERNLQVWRQLWRTVEASEVLLVLIDVRFPLLHYPPALEDYVRYTKKPTVLVLTKTDLVPPWLAQAWLKYFKDREAERDGDEGADVVIMESYKEVERSALTQGTQTRYTPSASIEGRTALVAALKRAHKKLMTPPKVVSDFPERLARWKPRVRQEVDFESIAEPDEAAATAPKDKKIRRNKAKDVYIPRRRRPLPDELEEVEVEVVEEVAPAPYVELEGDAAYPFFSVGLIGQPNVGKSSLLNALLQKKTVKTSRTPGKTKSLQTIYWNKTLRLVDCPGLVVPSFAGMERQVLAAIIPIQNVEPVLYFIGQRMPLEKILKLPHPEEDLTSDYILNAYAERMSFKTAKAGRNDLFRAGAFILRQIHSSTIPWSFRPPSEELKPPKEGLFIEDFRPQSAFATSEAEMRREMEKERSDYSEPSSEEEQEESGDEEDEGEDVEAADEGVFAAIKSAFAGLDVESGGDDSDEVSDQELDQ